RRPPPSPLYPYTTLFRSAWALRSRRVSHWGSSVRWSRCRPWPSWRSTRLRSRPKGRPARAVCWRAWMHGCRRSTPAASNSARATWLPSGRKPSGRRLRSSFRTAPEAGWASEPGLPRLMAACGKDWLSGWKRSTPTGCPVPPASPVWLRGPGNVARRLRPSRSSLPICATRWRCPCPSSRRCGTAGPARAPESDRSAPQDATPASSRPWHSAVDQLTAGQECPGPGDVQDVRVFLGAGQRRGRFRKCRDAQGGVIEQGDPAAAQDPRLLHAAVATHRHADHHFAGQLAATRLVRIVQVADPLDPVDPLPQVTGPGVLAGTGGHELAR